MPEITVKYQEIVTEEWVAKVDVPHWCISEGQDAIIDYCRSTYEDGDLKDAIMIESSVDDGPVNLSINK